MHSQRKIRKITILQEELMPSDDFYVSKSDNLGNFTIKSINKSKYIDDHLDDDEGSEFDLVVSSSEEYEP